VRQVSPWSRYGQSRIWVSDFAFPCCSHDAATGVSAVSANVHWLGGGSMSALDKASDALIAPVRLDAVSVYGRHWRCCCACAAIESIGKKLYTESRSPCAADR
jgi:hypothetical protein